MNKLGWDRQLMTRGWAESGPGEMTLGDLYSAFLERMAQEAQNEADTPNNEGEETWETLRRDALRYRWLRSQHWTSGKVAVVSTALLRAGHQTYSLERLDELLDKLIRGE